MKNKLKKAVAAAVAFFLFLTSAACGTKSAGTASKAQSGGTSPAVTDSLYEYNSSEASAIIDSGAQSSIKPEASKAETTQSKTASTSAAANSKSSSSSRQQKSAAVAKKDKYGTDPTPSGKPTPKEPQNEKVDRREVLHCTMSITCKTILDNMDKCDKPKRAIVPKDGVILSKTTVTFYKGESVFDILKRVCKEKGIHMEFSETPMYNSAYIEGIANLYEFDVGSTSGWMYKVNDWFPNYGCSRYQVKDNDEICWIYTCNLGADIGGGSGFQNTK